ncbi:hypothetical protein [Nonomuraea sp. NPDC049400]|uniref:hypothetical protein n=1 Tax=Nonomuraea sp. NPDC049400 TaxID=3364352 RepID=UPI003790EF69
MRSLGILLSAAVTAVGVLWWTTPASYPFGARDRVTVSFSHLFEHDLCGAMMVAAGLVGIAVSLLGPGPLARAGAVAEVLFFGVVMSDGGIMSALGYVVALSLPVALTVLVVLACVRRRLWGYVALAALVALIAWVWGPLMTYAGNVTAAFGSYAGRVAWTFANAVAFGAWVWMALRLYGGALPRWARPGPAARWGRAATIGAALCPLPYAAYRLTWLTPWPTDFSATGHAADLPIRLQGSLLGFAAVVACVLTLGLTARWGEVFPRWMPVLHGRPVPVRLPVALGGAVAGACLLAAPGVTVNFIEREDLLPLLLFPFPLWGMLLGAAVLAYWLRRGHAGGYAPVSTGG